MELMHNYKEIIIFKLTLLTYDNNSKQTNRNQERRRILNMEELTVESATAFLKQHEKEQSELCWKEMQETLKKYNRQISVINSIDNGVVNNKIILIKG